MAKEHAPDRITVEQSWVNGISNWHSGRWNTFDAPPPDHKPVYLLATTEREAAPELLEALERIIDAMPFGDEPKYALDAIRKARGE